VEPDHSTRPARPQASATNMHMHSLSQNDLMRLFIAVDVGDAVKCNLIDEQHFINKIYPGVKWVTPDAIHLTMAFLGDLWRNSVEAIAKVLQQAGKASTCFEMTIQGLGTFGSKTSPHVIWAGVGAGYDEITFLQRRISEALQIQNVTLESRSFHPHVTLGRIKASHDATELNHKLESCKTTAYGTFKVDHFKLMRSIIHPQGVTYSVLNEVTLQ